MPPQNSCPVQRVQSYLAIRAFASIQASGLTMSNDQQATKMLTSIAKPTGGFEYAGEYYTACRAFLSGTDPSMPSKTLIQPNELNIDRLLKATGGGTKMYCGKSLITKAIRMRLRRLSLRRKPEREPPSVRASRLLRAPRLATIDLLS